MDSTMVANKRVDDLRVRLQRASIDARIENARSYLIRYSGCT